MIVEFYLVARYADKAIAADGSENYNVFNGYLYADDRQGEIWGFEKTDALFFNNFAAALEKVQELRRTDGSFFGPGGWWKVIECFEESNHKIFQKKTGEKNNENNITV